MRRHCSTSSASGRGRAARASARAGAASPPPPAERTAEVTIGEPPPGTDLVFLAADAVADFEQLAALRERIRPDGAIWVVSRKGRAATLRDVEVIAAAPAGRLVRNKVVAVSVARP